MKFYSVLFASACALALAAPASAQVSALFGADYSHVSVDHVSINSWNGNGQGVFTLPDTGFNLQGNVGYTNLSGDGVSANDWNGGGAAFWADDMLRIGATVNYDSISVGHGANGNTTSYGGFAEWFPGIVTLGVKGGGVSGSGSVGNFGGSGTGSYIGGEAVVYPMPDFALSGTIDYSSSTGIHETDFTPQVEWLFSEDLPISAYIGYTYANLSGSGLGSDNGNVFFVGVRFYVNGTGAATLIDRQRSGTANWGTSFGPVGTNL